MKATLPGSAIPLLNVAFRPISGFITPRQFGPMSRIPPRRACFKTCCSNSRPAVPSSRNPAEITIAPLTPASAHCSITDGTLAAGVTTTAKSTFSGTAAIFGYAFIPSTFARLGFTGNTVPPKGLLTRFQSRVRPTLPRASVAPITAILRGSKIASSGRRFGSADLADGEPGKNDGPRSDVSSMAHI